MGYAATRFGPIMRRAHHIMRLAFGIELLASDMADASARAPLIQPDAGWMRWASDTPFSNSQAASIGWLLLRRRCFEIEENQHGARTHQFGAGRKREKIVAAHRHGRR